MLPKLTVCCHTCGCVLFVVYVHIHTHHTRKLYMVWWMQQAYVNDSGFAWQPIPELRDCQLSALRLPHTALVAATDLGDPLAPRGSVHSRRKQQVGARLARSAHALQTGMDIFHSMGPLYQHAVALPVHALIGYNSTAVVQVAVQFDNRTVQHGLQIKDAPCPVELGVPPEECGGFQIRTRDGRWHDASVRLDGSGRGIILQSLVSLRTWGVGESAIQTGATATRYGFAPWPLCVLYSGTLPAFPWRKFIHK